MLDFEDDYRRPPMRKPCEVQSKTDRPAFKRRGSQVLVPFLKTQNVATEATAAVTIPQAPWEAGQ